MLQIGTKLYKNKKEIMAIRRPTVASFSVINGHKTYDLVRYVFGAPGNVYLSAGFVEHTKGES